MPRGVPKNPKPKAPTLEDFVLPSDEASRKRIAGAVNEVMDVLCLQDANRDKIKDIVDSLQEELQVPKAFVTKLAKAQHRRRLKALEGEVDTLTSGADVLVAYGLKDS